jgi:hypothetical protein
MEPMGGAEIPGHQQQAPSLVEPVVEPDLAGEPESASSSSSWVVPHWEPPAAPAGLPKAELASEALAKTVVPAEHTVEMVTLGTDETEDTEQRASAEVAYTMLDPAAVTAAEVVPHRRSQKQQVLRSPHRSHRR